VPRSQPDSITTMAAADVDTGYIAGHLGLDQPVLTTLATEPTVDLVNILFQAIAAKAHEFDTLYAEKLQTDIELENAVRSSESRSQTSKATADKALKDVEEARQLLKDEGMCWWGCAKRGYTVVDIYPHRRNEAPIRRERTSGFEGQEV
jgi:hypothetical protein